MAPAWRQVAGAKAGSSNGLEIWTNGTTLLPGKRSRSALRAESEAFVASSADAAYDARGVDLTQIRRMLSLSPAERLEVLDGERRSIARLLENATGN